MSVIKIVFIKKSFRDVSNLSNLKTHTGINYHYIKRDTDNNPSTTRHRADDGLPSGRVIAMHRSGVLTPLGRTPASYSAANILALVGCHRKAASHTGAHVKRGIIAHLSAAAHLSGPPMDAAAASLGISRLKQWQVVPPTRINLFSS